MAGIVSSWRPSPLARLLEMTTFREGRFQPRAGCVLIGISSLFHVACLLRKGRSGCSGSGPQRPPQPWPPCFHCMVKVDGRFTV